MKVGRNNTDGDTVSARAAEISAHLPPGPFSKGRFIDHATGLNALANVADADAILSHLTDAGVLIKLPNVELWIIA